MQKEDQESARAFSGFRVEWEGNQTWVILVETEQQAEFPFVNRKYTSLRYYFKF